MFSFRLSKSLRAQKGFFKRRFLHFLNQGGWQSIVLPGYVALGSAFVNVPSEYQWLLAFISPVVREFFTWVTIKIACKSTGRGSEEKLLESTKFPILHYMSTKYAVFLAIVVGGVANEVTSYCILVLDFTEQMYHGLKIVWKYKKRNENVLGKMRTSTRGAHF